MSKKLLSAIRDTARQMLRDEFQAEDYTFPDDELDLCISKVLRKISDRRPCEVRETLTIGNKTGVATATTADHLIDTVNVQFTAQDVGKTVYNSTDGTTAKVTVYNSTSDLTLDTDIMASGESYSIYHYDGVSNNDLNIAFITDLLKVEKAEYPTGQNPPDFRNVRVFGDILTLDIDSTPTAGDDVILYCHKVHQLTEDASTLSPDLEEVLEDGTVALAARAYLNNMRKQIVPASLRLYKEWANEQYTIYQKGLDSITRSKVWEFYPRG